MAQLQKRPSHHLCQRRGKREVLFSQLRKRNVRTQGRQLHFPVPLSRLRPQLRLHCSRRQSRKYLYLRRGHSEIGLEIQQSQLVRQWTFQQGNSNKIFSVKFFNDDPNCFASAGWDNNVFLWDRRSPKVAPAFTFLGYVTPRQFCSLMCVPNLN